MNKKIIALFCGSFNPPLFSHFSLAEQLLNSEENIEKVIFIPVNSKYNKEGLIEDKHRFNMLNLVCKTHPKFEVSDIEFNMAKQPYTFETLQAVQKIYPDFEIRLIIGTDNLKEFNTWYEYKKLLTQFKVYVLARAEDNINEIIAQDVSISNYASSFIKTSISVRTNLNSTFVRNEIKNGNSVKFLLPDEIIDYIRNNNLYI